MEKVTDRTAVTREQFEQDEMLQVWAIYHLQVIGEAAGRISDGLKSQYPEVPWPDIVAMRNIMVHQYFSIDLDQVWSAAHTDLHALRAWVASILGDL